jgi:periplasmic protein TonB
VQKSLNATTPAVMSNDRFKKRFGDWFWYSIAGAALMHFALFAFWPEMTSADMQRASDQLVTIEIPDELVVPPAPEEIARPAEPVMGTLDIDTDVTIPPTTFDAHPAEMLRPPPAASGDRDIGHAPQFTPRTVEPELQNRREVEQVLQRNYPPRLRDAGIGGTPTVHLFIDVDGRVINTVLATSSGRAELDEAAVAVARVMRFSPALNREERVQVWVELPIVFTAR